MPKRCKKCKVPLEGFMYKWIAAKIFRIKPSEKDPELCNKCEDFAKIYDILDPKEDDIISTIQKRHKKEFDLAFKVLELANKIFVKKRDALLQWRITAWALYTQTFRLYRAIIVLSKVGQYYELQILLRSLFDNISYILYLTERDQNKRVEDYINSCNLSFIEAFDRGEKIFSDSITEKQARNRNEALRNVLSYFHKEYNANDIEEIKKRKLALTPYKAREKVAEHKELLGKCYQSFYKVFSMTLHGETAAKFVKFSADEQEITFNSGPSDKMIDSSLRVCIILFFIVIKRFNAVLDLGEESDINKVEREIIDLFGPINGKGVEGA